MHKVVKTDTTLASEVSVGRVFSKSDVFFILWGLLFFCFLATRFANNSLEAVFSSIASVNLVQLFAFFVAFKLTQEVPADKSCSPSDAFLISILVGLLLISSSFGVSADLGGSALVLAVYLFWFRGASQVNRFLSIVYFALCLNLTIAPIFFFFIKAQLVLGEVKIISFVWRFYDPGIVNYGNFIENSDGFRLRLIGMCSVYANLSFSFLTYASIKALFYQKFSRWDILVLLVLVSMLVLGNTVRIGLMLQGFDEFEYWHTGNGAVIFGIIQFFVVTVVALLGFVFVKKRSQYV